MYDDHDVKIKYLRHTLSWIAFQIDAARVG